MMIRFRSSKLGIGFVFSVIVCVLGALSFATSGPATRADTAPRIKRDVPTLSLQEAEPRAIVRNAGPHNKVTLASLTFDKCIQDDTDRSRILQFSSSTGAFQFTQCDSNPPVTFTGTGTVRTVNGCPNLSFRGSTGTVAAGFANGCTTGTASLNIQVAQGVFQTFKINDSNTLNNTCNTLPTATILTPNGGETMDAGSSFGINWSASDTVNVTSQDLLYSTDGGNTFTAIATGLAPAVTSYNWTVPQIANNQNVSIRVVLHDASCNTGTADCDSSFTVWNPGVSFAHLAEAPFYMVSSRYNSLATITNVSANPVTVELTMRAPAYGTATPNYPTQMTLAANEVVSVNLASLLNIPAPTDPADPNVVMGSVRLRHNGVHDGDIVATLANDHAGTDQSFTTPFIYPASFQTSSDGMQCGPMYYVGPSTSCYLAIQNTTNSTVPVTLMLNYGTGSSTGTAQMPLQTLYPQETAITDISAFQSQMAGSQWGSVSIQSTPQAVVAHCVSISAVSGFAFNSNFIAPAEAISTTKIASPLKIDPVNGHEAYVMVCNESGSARTVTATFNTSNGVSIPSQTVSLSAGQQQLIEIPASQVSAATYADVRLTYSGNPSDIVAGACSMSPTDSRALAANFVEAKPNDNRHLVSPFFKFGPAASGMVQLSNVTASDVKVGLRMRFAGVSGPAAPTSLITVPANGTAMVDLQQQFYDRVPDGVTPQGSLELTWAGAAGSVTASFTQVGNDGKTPISQDQPFIPDQSPVPGMSMYPAGAVVIPGGCTEVDAITDGSTTPSAQVSSPDQCFGQYSVTWQPVGGSSVMYTSSPVCVPISCSTGAVINPPPGTGDTASVDGATVRGLSFTTPLGGRMEPDGNTPFTISSSKDQFPAGQIVVEFDSGGASVTAAAITSDGTMSSIPGIAPANPQFIGNVTDIKLFLGQASGKPFAKISGGGGGFYAYDPPTNVSVSPSSQDRAGGVVTISGTGFRVFDPVGPAATVYPTVTFGGIDFTLDTTSITSGSPATLSGTVQHAPSDLLAGPVKVKITNPGDQGPAGFPGAYTLKPGPAPSPKTLKPTSGFDSGGTLIKITGQNMYVVRTLEFANPSPSGNFTPGAGVQVTHLKPMKIEAVSPGAGDPNFSLCPTGQKQLSVLDADQAFPAVAGIFQYNPAPLDDPTNVLAHALAFPVVHGGGGGLAFPVGVGPCESVTVNPNTFTFGSNGCLVVTITAQLTSQTASENNYLITIAAVAQTCAAPTGSPTVVYNFTFTITGGFLPVSVQGIITFS